MLVPRLNPGSPGFRYRCLYPSQELMRRRWPVQFLTPQDTVDADVVVIMSDVCLGSDNHAQRALQGIARLKQRGVRVVVTETDNRFYNPMDNQELARKANYLRQLFRLADEVVVTTEPLADALRDEGIVDVPMTLIPDALETEQMLLPSGLLARLSSYRHWAPRRDLSRLALGLRQLEAGGSTPIVWFGGHGTARGEAGGMRDLLKLRELLEGMHRSWPLSLTVISDNPDKFAANIQPWGVPTFYLPWNRLVFHRALRLHQICILPITASPWTVCKSSNRLLTALHSGLACIADEISSYRPFQEVCRLGNWEQSLTHYLSTPAQRQTDRTKAATLIDREWTIASVSDLWEAMLLRQLKAS